MNKPASLDFKEVYQGSTFYESLQYTQEDGTNIDLDGYSAKMQVRKLPGKKILTTFDTSDNSIFLNRSEAFSGTVDATASATIAGTGTTLTGLAVNDRVVFDSLGGSYTVIAVNSDIEIEINQAVTVVADTINKIHVGRIELRKESSETIDWKADKYQYDLELTQGIETFKLMKGLFIVNSEITE